jgi:hypothetical protein
MSQRRLRDELRDVFEGMSEPAHPALSARIRERLTSRPAPGPRVPRLAAAVAVLAAILIVASLLFVSQRGPARPTVPAGPPVPTAPATPPATATPVPVAPGPTASAQPQPTPSPSGSAAPADAGLPPFSCAAQSAPGPTSPPAGVTAVRASAQSGYDRFVIEIDGSVGQYSVEPQASATFTQDPSGRQVTLSGSAGLAVTVHAAQSAGSYTGSTDLKPSGTAVLKEARQTGDFEGVVSWGLGLSHTACFRAFTLSNPSRLVVDVKT